MATFHLVLGWLLALVWLHRLLDIGLGMRQVADIARPEWDRRLEPEPRVTIIVPARNEQDHVETAVGSLLELQYENYEVIAVNDRSTDRTGKILNQLASASAGKLRVLHVSELPSGWLGKNHAMWKAAATASGEWLLFTDADVVFRPDALRRALAYALEERADHLVLFPEVKLHTVGERMMTAFFMSLFIFGHRPWKVADPKTRDHMGVGAFNLVRRTTYEAIGTHQTLRLEVIDDMKLGKLVKLGGFAQRNVIGHGLVSLRWAHGAMGVVRNLTKNMFALMEFRWPRTLGAAFLLLLLNIAPFAGVPLAPAGSRLGYAVAVTAIATLYVRMAPPLGVNPLYFLLHPVAGLLFAYTLLRSAGHAWRHGGVIWRDTKYSLEELRRGLV
ncbi:MAG TPA: glycosyltransferase family 2 protein [Terriglobales bacterium]|nr:glycosyltransferase family 2 protein [Terriglobales bacterium]